MGAKAEAAQQELDEYRKKVRSVAIQTATDRGWCQPGLNEVLRDLGLPEKKTHRVPVDVTYTQRKYITLADAESPEEARSRISGMEPSEVAALLETLRGLTVTGFTVPEPPAPGDVSQVTVDDVTSELPEGTYESDPRQWCGRRTHTGYSCSRPVGHGGDFHIAANTERVVRVWNTGDTDDRGGF